MRKVIALVIAFMSVLAGCSRPWQTSSVEPVPPSLDASYASPRADAYGLRHGRTHVRDLQSSLEVHRRRPHNTLMNMEERRAR